MPAGIKTNLARDYPVFVQKLPLPWRERGGVRGSKRKRLKFLTIITPTLPSPIEREGKTGFPDEH
jgi:hypothetical protein